MIGAIELRAGCLADAVAIAALATQVFLDTYATGGVRPDVAREAFREYSKQAFKVRLEESQRKFIIAAQGESVLGFAELICSRLEAPAGGLIGAELVRLYVQRSVQRGGLGRALIQEAEGLASQANLASIWLTAWDGNSGALAFYRRLGYADIGATTYSFEGKTVGNRVFGKRLAAA